MIQRLVISLLLSLAVTLPARAEIAVGSQLPSIHVAERGELVLKDKKEVSYQPWSTDQLRGKVHVLQAMAGRMSTKNLNKPFTDALEKENFSHDHLLTTTVINLDDTLFGTAGIVNSELKSNKIKYWYSSIVADKNGAVAKALALQPSSSAIAVISPTGEVLFFKDGAMTEAEIATALELVKQQTAALAGRDAESHQSAPMATLGAATQAQ